MSSTCCFCPSETINWNKPGGLCNWNLPCNSTKKTIFPVYAWNVDQETNVIFIPDKSILLPSFLLCLPVFWIHFCLMGPMLKSDAFFLYEYQGQFRLDAKCKHVCSEELKYYRNNITHAEIESKTTMFLEYHRVSFFNSSSTQPDKTEWFRATGEIVNISLNLIQTINRRAEEIQARNMAPSYALAVPLNNQNYSIPIQMPQYPNNNVAPVYDNNLNQSINNNVNTNYNYQPQQSQPQYMQSQPQYIQSQPQYMQSQPQYLQPHPYPQQAAGSVELPPYLQQPTAPLYTNSNYPQEQSKQFHYGSSEVIPMGMNPPPQNNVMKR